MVKPITFFALVMMMAMVCLNCATIIHGTSQQVGISSNPSGARVTVDGKAYGNTPLTANLSRKDNHTIKIDLSGYSPYEINLTRSVSGWIAGNIIFGGLIGLAIDAISGGMYKLKPGEIVAELRSAGATLEEMNDQIFITVVMEPDPTWEKIGQLSR